jgi:hypothetical protein
LEASWITGNSAIRRGDRRRKKAMPIVELNLLKMTGSLEQDDAILEANREAFGQNLQKGLKRLQSDKNLLASKWICSS